MPNPKNIATVKDLTEKLQKVNSVVLADYAGLPVSLQQKLRQQVLKADGELLIAKNTLLKIAFKNHNMVFPESLANALTGPNITLFAYQDPIAPLKVLAKFQKENDLPKIKAGFLAKDPLDKNQLLELSKLPSKLELIAKTITVLKAPLTGFHQVLISNLRNLIYVLKAIKKEVK